MKKKHTHTHYFGLRLVLLARLYVWVWVKKEEHFSGLDMLVMSLVNIEINISNGIFYGHFWSKYWDQTLWIFMMENPQMFKETFSRLYVINRTTSKKQQQYKLLLLSQKIVQDTHIFDGIIFFYIFFCNLNPQVSNSHYHYYYFCLFGLVGYSKINFKEKKECVIFKNKWHWNATFIELGHSHCKMCVFLLTLFFCCF